MRLAEWTTGTASFVAAGALAMLAVLGPRVTPAGRTPEVGRQTPEIAGLEVEITGDVIAPPVFADAQPYPRGMVIAPPETGDHMTIVAPGQRTIEQILFGVFGALMTIHA